MDNAADNTDDRQLLARYVGDADQAAFEALARRYAGLVYSAAKRRMRDGDLAHDVTQVVFLVLAKKAATIRTTTVLSAWLLKATRYTANNMSKSEYRRRRREQEVASEKAEEAASSVSPANSAKDEWDQVAPLLDDALASLGESGRAAVVLRWFEGRSFRDVGERLGVSEEAAKQKVFRALGRMRRYLLGRGVAVPTATLATLISAHAAQAAPAATVAAAASAGAPAALAAAAPPIVHTVATLMAWTKAKILTGAIAAALVVSGTAVAVKMVLAERRGVISAERRAVPPAPSVKPAAIPKPQGMVLAPNGQPLKGASVLLSTRSQPATYRGDPSDYLTDDKGQFAFPAINEPFTVIAWHDQAGFAEVTSEQLAEATGRVSLMPWAKLEGRASSSGAAAANATIVLGRWSPTRDGVSSTSCLIEVRTDADGKFAFPRVPPGDNWVGRQVPVADAPPAMVHQTYVTAQPGQRLTLPLGGAAGSRIIVGRLKASPPAPPASANKLQWDLALVRSLEAPSQPNRVGQSAYQGSMFQSDVPVAEDGAFRAEDIPAGSYRLVGRAIVRAGGGAAAFKIVEQPVIVSAAAGSDPAGRTMNLGTITVTLPPLGDTAGQTPADALAGKGEVRN